MTSLKLRVVDGDRIGRIEFLSFFKNFADFSFYDDNGEPTEDSPVLKKLSEVTIEAELDGKWVPVQLEAI